MPRVSADLRYIEIPSLLGGVDSDALPTRLAQGKVLRSENLVPTDSGLRQTPGTILGGGTAQNDMGMKAFTLDGNDYAASSAAGLRLTGSQTVNVIIQPDSVTGEQVIVGRWGSAAANRVFRLYLNGTTLTFAVGDGTNPAVEISLASAAAISRVMMITAGFQATGSGTIYLRCQDSAGNDNNTTNAAVGFTALATSTEDFRVGADNEAGSIGNYYSGKVGYLHYQSTYVVTNPSFEPIGLSQGLWRGEQSGGAVLDEWNNSGSVRNLTITGTFVNAVIRPCAKQIVGTVLATGEFQAPADSFGTDRYPFAITERSIYVMREYVAGDKYFSNRKFPYTSPTGYDNNLVMGLASGDSFVDGTDGPCLGWVVGETKSALGNAIQPQKIIGATGNSGNMSTSLANYRASVFRSFGFRGNLYNLYETTGPNRYDMRHLWSAQNQIGDGDWTVASDWTDLDEDPGAIINALRMGDSMMIYKERSSIIAQSLSGRSSPTWTYRTIIKTNGLAAPRSLVALPTGPHIFLGNDDVYLFDGRIVKGLARGRVSTILLENAQGDEAYKFFGHYFPEVEQYWLFYTKSDSGKAACSEGFCYSFKHDNWFGPLTFGGNLSGAVTSSYINRASSGFKSGLPWHGVFLTAQEPNDATWAFSSWLLAHDPTQEAFNNNPNGSFAGPTAAAISTTLIFPRFEVRDDKTQVPIRARFLEFEVEAAVDADATLTLSTSPDQQDTWTSQGSPAVNPGFDENYRRYTWYFDVESDQLDIRIVKTGNASDWKPISGRVGYVPMEQR